jgi:hypothetical protein
MRSGLTTKPIEGRSRPYLTFQELFEDGDRPQVQPLNGREILSDAGRVSCATLVSPAYPVEHLDGR